MASHVRTTPRRQHSAWLIGMMSVLLILIAAPPLRAAPTVIFVEWDATGDHTTKIEQAFQDAKTAGPGSIVELGEGTFIIHKPIVVEDFDGTFQGSGKAEFDSDGNRISGTVVQNKHAEGELFPATQFPLPAFTGLFAFYSTTGVERGGTADDPANLTFSDMTLKQLGLPQPYKYHLNLPYLYLFNDFIFVAGRNVAGTNVGTPAFIDVTFRSMDVIGEVNPSHQWGYNAAYGLSVKGWAEMTSTWVPEEGGWLIELVGDIHPITGDFVWSDCSFSGMEVPIAVYEADDSAVQIDGIAASDVFWVGVHAWNVASSTVDISNVIVENLPGSLAYGMGLDALTFWDPDGTDVHISNLSTTNIAGLWIGNEVGEAPSTFELHDSVIRKRASSDWAGVELWDWLGAAGSPTLNVAASGNTFYSDGSIEPFGPVFSFGVDGAVFDDNRFLGFGAAAIHAEPWTEGKNWIISENDVQDFTPRSSPTWASQPAHIILGPGTSGFTVVGGRHNDRVLDYGTANTVTGAIHLQRHKPDFPPGLEMLEKEKALEPLSCAQLRAWSRASQQPGSC